MPTNWDTVNTKCPFYFTESSHTITCEGLECQSDLHNFVIKQNKDRHKKRYCNNCYHQCRYCKALLQLKYEEKSAAESTKK